MASFFVGLFLLCASTLMYEVVLTRLLSVVCWYYLAFVSVSMAMFGMTAGALTVQLRPHLFTEGEVPRRLVQASLAAAISMPLALVTMLAVPVELSLAVETLYSFLLFSAIIAVPFFFSGVAVCLSLTRMPFSVGHIYATDMLGASLGCFASVVLLKLMDAPSAILAISALLFLSAGMFARYANNARLFKTSGVCALGVLVLAGLNASTLHGIQPIWLKGHIDTRTGILAEIWNPISRVRVYHQRLQSPTFWGPSPRAPRVEREAIGIDIDSDAYTEIARYEGDFRAFDYLRYDVTSVGAQLRHGGTAAIIGIGGGRDALNCAANDFRRIVGIEVNSTIVDLTTHRFEWFSGFSKIPGLEIHNDEGRSYLTRSGEHFDLIQASMVDTWAATSAGAMSLSENALYTVDAWQVFYRHLKPGGLITFSRWYRGAEKAQTYRLFSVAWATLLAEGVSDPGNHLALMATPDVATLLASNQPLSQEDLLKLRDISGRMAFEPVFLPGQETAVTELRTIAAARSWSDLTNLRDRNSLDYSPVLDSSPYFFNAVHLANLWGFLAAGGYGANLRAMLFVFGFMLAAIILVLLTIGLPLRRWASRHTGSSKPSIGFIVYFVTIGLGFMLVEMAMMQQLSIFLGHPVYSLVVVLAGLILSTGIGSFVSDRLVLGLSWRSRTPAIAAAFLIALYSSVVLPAIHAYTVGQFWQRIAVCLALVVPCGFVMGFCFPVGLRWMILLGQQRDLPWMWALNGAAGTLGSFVAIVISMDTSIRTCALTGAVLYLVAGLTMAGLPQRPAECLKARVVSSANV